MDLNAILEKTKAKSERAKRSREPVFIATAERPYDLSIPEKNLQQPVLAPVKTDNKLVTNQQQSDNKLATNRKQTGNKTATKKINPQQSDNKLVTKLTTEAVTNWQQTVNKLTTNVPFTALVGLQRTLILLMYQECKRCRDKVTDPLTLEYISHQVNADQKTIKTSIYRLEGKGYLQRKEFKNGRGGWTRYEIPDGVFHEILQQETGNKLITNWQQSDNKVVSEVVTKPTTSLPSSSSYINKATTTELPQDWLEIDLEDARHFGLTQNHLLQLFKEGLDREIVIDSLRHFLFDLEHNGKAREIKTNPLVYFMGIMKRVGVYAAPDNYESPKERAMRLYLEKQKAIQEKNQALEKELMNAAFNRWVDVLDENDKNNILPDEVRRMNLTAPKIASLRLHFEKEIWSMKKQEMLDEIMRST